MKSSVFLRGKAPSTETSSRQFFPRRIGEVWVADHVIVLDTHVILWLALDPAKISANAKIAIAQARQASDLVAASDITLLEISIAESKGRVRLNTSLELFLGDIESRFTILPLTASICARAMAFSTNFPRDPADRIISATAVLSAAPLVTADEGIRRSRALNTIW